METLNIIRKSNYAIIEINNGKVNAINESLGRDLIESFGQLEEDDDIKGVILAGRPHCFSAGLDIVSLAQSDREGGKNFWRAYLGAFNA